MAESKCACLNCGSYVRYNIAERDFSCDYCGSRFTYEQIQAAYPDEQNSGVWEAVSTSMGQTGDPSVGWKSETMEQEAHLHSYNCPSCGAEILVGEQEETLAAAFCAFCKNPVSITARLVSGADMPSRIIPFKKTREEALDIFRRKMKRKLLIPAIFKSTVENSDIRSVYIPFKLFDANCSANVIALCKRITKWRDSRYEYTKTDTYEARRAGMMDFCGLPVDASEKIPDEDMQAIEPFATDELTPFSKKYLLGHFAETPTTQQEAMNNTAFRRIDPAAQQVLLDTILGYNTVTPISGITSINEMASEYVMLPVWLMTARYKDKDYAYAINGQTGKFGGKFPVDWKHAGKLFLISFAILFLAIFFGGEVFLWITG